MVTLYEQLNSSYTGKLKEFFDYIRIHGGVLNGMSLSPGDWIQIQSKDLKDYDHLCKVVFTEDLICTQDARTGLMGSTRSSTQDAILFWRKYKPNGSKYILTTGRSLRIKSKDPVFVCINPTITNIPDFPIRLTDKNAKQWLYSFRVSVKDPVEKALREIGYTRSFRTYFESMRSIMDYDKLLTPSEYLEIHSLVVSINRLIDDYQYIKATGHDLSLAVGVIANKLNPVVARVALKKLEGKIPERGKKALRRRLLEGLTQAIEHFVILLERIS
jgi:hypothetical protein